ncbi:MAG: hypothetical protein IT364_02760 [Candidatus Hydrogenedentes bacterium]|nr:hypothetical protein [Candidatus Hydrogenedentota bacterium]
MSSFVRRGETPTGILAARPDFDAELFNELSEYWHAINQKCRWDLTQGLHTHQASDLYPAFQKHAERKLRSRWAAWVAGRGGASPANDEARSFGWSDICAEVAKTICPTSTADFTEEQVSVERMKKFLPLSGDWEIYVDLSFAWYFEHEETTVNRLDLVFWPKYLFHLRFRTNGPGFRERLGSCLRHRARELWEAPTEADKGKPVEPRHRRQPVPITNRVFAESVPGPAVPSVVPPMTVPADLTVSFQPLGGVTTLNPGPKPRERSDRRAAVDAYIEEVFVKTGRRITRSDIWRMARYKSRTEFERWERNDHKNPNRTAEERFARILAEKPHLK